MKSSDMKNLARTYSVSTHIKLHNSPHGFKQQGYTLLEVLVAMTLGLVVLGSAITMQISHREAYALTESKLSMQTNAKFAHEFIAASLREMGAVGCRTVKNYYAGSDQNDDSGNYIIAFNNPDIAFANFKINEELLGYENAEGSGSWSPGVSSDFSFGADMLDGSDAITVRGAIGPTYRVEPDDIAADSVQLNLSNVSNVQLRPNQYAVLSRCDVAEVFHITGTEAQINAGSIFHGAGALGDDNEFPTFKQDFANAIESTAELRRVAVTTYYIAENENGIPTLFRDVDNVSDPMVEGVERMQIEYGINTDTATMNVPDEYHDAQWVNNQNVWGDVVSVRLSFIMRSRNELYEQNLAKTYSLPGVVTYDYAVNDKYARMVYTATVNLRNRSLGARI